jgi:dienelactone hydrolase
MGCGGHRFFRSGITLRTLELTLIVVIVGFQLGILALQERSGLSAFFLFVAVLVAFAQWRIEGYRWQLLPAYFFLVLSVALEIARRLVLFHTPSLPELFAFFAVVFTCALCWIFPVFKLPIPTGPYKIGTVIAPLVDRCRNEIFLKDSEASRELMIQIWFPVDSNAQGELATYSERGSTGFRWRHHTQVRTHALRGVGLSGKVARYPLLIFLPSWSGGRGQSLFQVEELVSHGYIVVGIDHPYCTGTTIFPDGRIIHSTLAGGGLDFSSEKALERILHTCDEQLRIRAEDARFVVDQLEELDCKDPTGLLTGRLDLNRVGILGYSLGGGAALETTWLDSRFKVGVDLDGLLGSESARDGARVPFLFLCNGDPIPKEEDLTKFRPTVHRQAEFDRRQLALIEHSIMNYGGFLVMIKGASHRNFCDAPLYSPLRVLTGAGSIGRDRAFRLVNAYTLAFLDEYLKKHPSPLIESLETDFPEGHLVVGIRAKEVARMRRQPIDSN